MSQFSATFVSRALLLNPWMDTFIFVCIIVVNHGQIVREFRVDLDLLSLPPQAFVAMPVNSNCQSAIFELLSDQLTFPQELMYSPIETDMGSIRWFSPSEFWRNM
jgi:hypothetical protein